MRRDGLVWALAALCVGLTVAVVVLAYRGGSATAPSPIELDAPTSAPAHPATAQPPSPSAPASAPPAAADDDDAHDGDDDDADDGGDDGDDDDDG